MTSYQLYGLLLTIIMGFGWGSFATMATYRLPKGMPWIGDKPRCLMCKHELGLIDYFSVFSFFLWRGKCRYCKGEFECNVSYFLTEFFITLLLCIAFWRYDFGDLFVLYTGLIVTGVILSVIEAESRVIPSKVLITFFTIAAVYRTFTDGTFYGVIYAAFLAGILGIFLRWLYYGIKGDWKLGTDFTRWQHTDRFIGEGFEYVKLLIVCAVWLSYEQFTVFVPAVIVVGFLWQVIHKRSLRFGALMTATLMMFLLYPEIGLYLQSLL
jgi:prepilin signal peptidase PulO-like enzyme (type II secretory pathway)